jgi:lipopolysaccharide export system permease protein
LRIEASEDEGRRLIGIFARVANSKGQVLSISAREGSFLATSDSPDTIILRLSDGTIVQDADNETPRVLSFSRHDLPIDLPRVEEFRERGDAEREYILPELLSIGWSDTETEEKRDASQASFNFRLVEVVMMLLMPLLAVALAIPPKRSSSALGVFVSIIMVVSYHKINQYGEDIAALGRVDPIIALWGPFVVFAALILWMYYRVAYVPGGQAIGALESGFAKLSKLVRGLFKRRKPASRAALETAPAE